MSFYYGVIFVKSFKCDAQYKKEQRKPYKKPLLTKFGSIINNTTGASGAYSDGIGTRPGAP